MNIKRERTDFECHSPKRRKTDLENLSKSMITQQKNNHEKIEVKVYNLNGETLIKEKMDTNLTVGELKRLLEKDKEGIRLIFNQKKLEDDALLLKDLLNNKNQTMLELRCLRIPDEVVKMIHRVSKDGYALEEASEALKNTKEVVMAAVRQDGRALLFASEALKKTKEVVMAAVMDNGETLYYADSFKDDFDVVSAAVASNGLALQYASERLKNDKEIVMKAISQNGEAVMFAAEDLKNNQDIVGQAVKNNFFAVEYLPEHMQSDEMNLQAEAALLQLQSQHKRSLSSKQGKKE